MGDANVAAIERVFDGFARRDNDVALQLYDPNIVWDSSAVTGLQDLQGIYHGIDGVRAWWRTWLAAWETIEFDRRATQHTAHGNQVVSTWVQRNRGKGSGLELDMETGIVWTFQNGRVVRAAVFASHAETRQAAGLPPHQG